MRTMQECYEEALRRSEERIKERKKRRTHLLVACIPLVLCLTIFAGFLLPGFGVSTDMAAPEATLPLYHAGSAMGDGAVILMDSVEVVGNGLSHKYTAPEEVREIMDFITSIVTTPQTNTTTETFDIITDSSLTEDALILPGEGTLVNGYQITLLHSSGTTEEYTLLGPSLTNCATGEVFPLNEETYFALKDLLGIYLYGG